MWKSINKLRNIIIMIVAANVAEQLLDILFKPILVYVCEVWATECADIIGKIHLKLCKYIMLKSEHAQT